MNNRFTKLILIFIALGLWTNAAATFMRPTPAAAQFNSDARIAVAVEMIAFGTCTNRKLC